MRLTIHRRRKGKIAQLPEPLREQINRLLLDGQTYAAIIASLGPAGQHLNKDNLSRWRKADHQDWLARQLWIKIRGSNPELPPDLESTFLLSHELHPQNLTQALHAAPTKFLRLLKVREHLIGTTVWSALAERASARLFRGDGSGDSAFAGTGAATALSRDLLTTRG